MKEGLIEIPRDGFGYDNLHSMAQSPNMSPPAPVTRALNKNLQQIDLTKFLEKEFFDVADESADAIVNGEVEQRRGDLRVEAVGLIRIFDTVQIIEKQNKG